MKAEGPSTTIRACQGFAELDACVELQRRTWGYDDSDVIPRRLFVVAQRIGGQAIGAFSDVPGAGVNGLVGFALALPGVRGGSPYLHSHMLAVVPEHRNAGLGRRLKLAQREDALHHGIHLMEWTFDPLEIKNAFFNIARLGVIVRTYVENAYGVSSARLQGGRPTDRLVAEWWMDSPRVAVRLAGGAQSSDPVRTRITLPADVMHWKESEEGRQRATALQRENRARFEKAFSEGLAVTGFTRDGDGSGCFELTAWTPASISARALAPPSPAPLSPAPHAAATQQAIPQPASQGE